MTNQNNASQVIVLKKKPTRRELLMGITRLQNLVGKAMSCHGNDRDPNGFEKGSRHLEEAHHLCIELRSFDPICEELRPPVDEANAPAAHSEDGTAAAGGRIGPSRAMATAEGPPKVSRLRPTPAQLARLLQVAAGQIERIGNDWIGSLYHFRGSVGCSPTYVMVCSLHDAGWVEIEHKGGIFWRVVLTEAGRAATAEAVGVAVKGGMNA